MKLTNQAELFVKVMGQTFSVRHVAKTIDEANEFMSANPDTSFISEGNGLFYVADNEPLKVIYF